MELKQLKIDIDAACKLIADNIVALVELAERQEKELAAARDGLDAASNSLEKIAATDEEFRRSHEHWMTLAHIICAGAGIPPGHIQERLNALRDQLETQRTAVESTSLPELRDHLKAASIFGKPITLSSAAADALYVAMSTGLPAPVEAIATPDASQGDVLQQLSDQQCHGMKVLSALAADMWAEGWPQEPTKEMVDGYFVRDLLNRAALAGWKSEDDRKMLGHYLTNLTGMSCGQWYTVAVEVMQDEDGVNLGEISIQVKERADERKYQAELYDEVWAKAKAMGYANVTMALADLTALMSPVTGANSINKRAEDLIRVAESRGLVLRIETEPLSPLAMGNYKMVASVQARREPGVPYDQLGKSAERRIV